MARLLARSETLQTKGESAEAERLLRQFITTENIAPDDKIVALNSLGVLMTALDRPDEAERHFRRALDIAEHSPEIVPVTLLRIRFNLAAVSVENHQYEKAKALLNKITDSDVAQARDRWKIAGLRGAVAVRTGEYDVGKEIFEAHLRELDRSNPTLELAITLNNLGIISMLLNDYQTAVRYLSDSAVVWRASPGRRHSNLVRTLVNLAVAQEHVGDKDGARATVKESLSIARKELGESHPIIPSVYEVSSGVLSKIGSKREAKELKRTAQRIRQDRPAAALAGAVVDITELSTLSFRQ